MKKYYFDRVSEQRSEYDFVGTVLPTADRAVQIAELIAIELGMDGDGTWHARAYKGPADVLVAVDRSGHIMSVMPSLPDYQIGGGR